MRTILIVVSVLLAISLTCGITFAYFNGKSGQQDVTISTEIVDGDLIVTVGDFSAFALASKTNYYNDSSVVSGGSYNRKIIRFSADVVLANNLFVTADVHIDLNGYILDLNGCTLTVCHDYAGTFSVQNGYICSGEVAESSEGAGDGVSAGAFVIDVLQAKVVFDDVKTSSKTVTVSEEDETTTVTYTREDSAISVADDGSYSVQFVKDVSTDSAYLTYLALYTVGAALSSNLEKRPERLTYAQFSVLTVDSEKYAASNFVVQKQHADSATGNTTTESCVYVVVGNDLVLPASYQATDVEISYSSDNVSYVSAFGNALATGDATLTVTVKVSSDSDGVSVAFPVHVVESGDVSIAEPLLKSYLVSYYDSENDYYNVINGLELPLFDDDLGLKLSYKLLDSDKVEVETTSHNATDDGDYNGYIIEPNDKCAWLQITATSAGDSAATESFSLQINSNFITTTESIAYLVADSLYGGSLTYDSSHTELNLVTLSDITSADYADAYNALQLYEQMGIVLTDISYVIKDRTGDDYDGVTDSNDYYELQTGTDDSGNKTYTLAVTDTPAYKSGYVTVTFSFTEDGKETAESIDLLVFYASAGTGASSYLTYFNKYDGYVSPSVTESFEMPFTLDNSGSSPYTVYEFVKSDDYIVDSATGVYTFNGANGGFSAPSAITLNLVYNNQTLATFSYDGVDTTIAQQFSSWLGTNGTYATLSSIPAGAYWEVTVDSTKLSFDDVGMLIVYGYTFADGNSQTVEWNYYQTHLEEDDENSEELYYTDYTTSAFTLEGGIYRTEGAGSENAVNSALFDWIAKQLGKVDSDGNVNVTFIENDALGQSLTMDAQTDSTLSTLSDWNGLKYLTGLTEANLSGLTNVTVDMLNRMTKLESLTLQNCGLTDLTGLALPELRTMDISHNSISYFDWLTTTAFPSLEVVYLYDNVEETSYTGSNGLCNYRIFEYLQGKAITVYNTTNSNGMPVSFEEVSETNDYTRLKDIAYQEIIGANDNIENVYSMFTSLTADDFKLEGSYSSISWGNGTNADGEEYFYVILQEQTENVAFEVDYYVNRKSG